MKASKEKKSKVAKEYAKTLKQHDENMKAAGLKEPLQGVMGKPEPEGEENPCTDCPQKEACNASQKHMEMARAVLEKLNRDAIERDVVRMEGWLEHLLWLTYSGAPTQAQLGILAAQALAGAEAPFPRRTIDGDVIRSYDEAGCC